MSTPRSKTTQIGLRRVEGADLDNTRIMLGLDVLGAQFLYGKSMLAWMNLTNEQGAGQPLRSGTLSLLARYLNQHPEDSFIPDFPTPQQVMEILKTYDPSITAGELGLLLGREITAGYRWFTEQRGASSELQRLMLLLLTALEKRGHNALVEWRRMCEMEAQARGIDDLWRHRRWTKKTPKTKEKPSS